MKKASVILYLFDLSATNLTDIQRETEELKQLAIPFIRIGNKIEKANPELLKALYRTATDDGNGSWEYSTDGGTTWNTVTVLTGSNGLLLTSTDKVRFVPGAKNATTAHLTYHAWDRSAGTAGTLTSLTTTGGKSPFSTAADVVTIHVDPVNDAPINHVAPSYSGDFRGDGTLRQDGTVTANPGLWHDVDAGDPATTFRYVWEGADDAAGTNLAHHHRRHRS